jgi:hypothetical protein
MTGKLLLAGAAAAAAVLGATAGDAYAGCPQTGDTATNRCMIVLLDHSGSMLTERYLNGVPQGNRFQAAKTLAAAEIARYSLMGRFDGIAVYTFRDGAAGIIQRTNDGLGAPDSAFIDPSLVPAIINGLPDPDWDAVTPLAGSMCDMMNKLRAIASSNLALTRVLHVSTDGFENDTPFFPANECGGPPSGASEFPFDDEVDIGGGVLVPSWHWRVSTKASDGSAGYISIIANLFEADRVINPFTFTAAKVTSAEQSMNQFRTFLAAAGDPLSDFDFFSALAENTGGTFKSIEDSTLPEDVPVPGDFDGDGCVTLDDAIDVIGQFGQPVPGPSSQFDVNLDRTIGYADYQAVKQNLGTCATPDTRTAHQVIQCRGLQAITLNNRFIETAGDAIEVRGACSVTLKNSRIVAGGTAIRVTGSAQVITEDSIVAGERSFLVMRGSAVLMSKRTYFKGSKDLTGAFAYIDLGGNTWVD